MLWLDRKFVLMLGARLERFKVKSEEPFIANCRCPFCGDSKRKASKTRGYFFRDRDRDKIFFKCHNCGLPKHVRQVLKELAPDLYDEYKMEFLRENGGRVGQERRRVVRPPKDQPMEVRIAVEAFGLTRVSDLLDGHEAVQYLKTRRVPIEAFPRLYWTDDYYGWVNRRVVPDKFPKNARRSSRIVFPFTGSDMKPVGFTGRAINRDEIPRYVTVKVDEGPKVFGLDAINKQHVVLAFEGPMDSLFFENSVAMAGADFDPTAVGLSRAMTVIVYDNEPRNREIVARMRKFVDEGWSVVVWPKQLMEKDVNDMVLAGYSPETIRRVIAENTRTGTKALIALNDWKRVSA